MKTLTILLMLSCTVLGERQYFSNRWAVELTEGEDADLIAREHGFVNIGKIFGNYYTFIHPKVAKRSADRSDHHHVHLSRHAGVLSVQQQEIYKRSKRESNTGLNISDPMFPKMWYMNEHTQFGFPSLNVLDAWRQCRTGKGVIVAVVDDGIDFENQDLKENFNRERSFNARSGSDSKDVFPAEDDEHGTKAAGVIAASSNGFCGIGVAYNASIAAIRIFPGEATDDIEATAFSAKDIDIFSNSWGPNDYGQYLGAVGPLAAKAIKTASEEGRGGKGAIFVFSGGNGAIHGDSCAYDGYVNSRYTIAVNPVTRDGQATYGAETCSAIMVTSYSRMNTGGADIWTTGRGVDGCTGEFKESSAAAPFVSGAIALALEADPLLTWRDIQHLLTLTSNSNVNFKPDNWIVNKAGFKVSPTFGFGLLDIGELVARAKTWKTLQEPAKECVATVQTGLPYTFSGVNGTSTLEFKVDNCDIGYLEHVMVTVNISFCARGFFTAKLKSPGGTESELLPGRRQDYESGILEWTVSSVAFWGENPVGAWKLTIEGTYRAQQYYNQCREGVVDNVNIRMHGSGENPRKNLKPTSTEYNCEVQDNTEKLGNNPWFITGMFLLGIIALLFIICLILCCIYKIQVTSSTSETELVYACCICFINLICKSVLYYIIFSKRSRLKNANNGESSVQNRYKPVCNCFDLEVASEHGSDEAVNDPNTVSDTDTVYLHGLCECCLLSTQILALNELTKTGRNTELLRYDRETADKDRKN